MRQSQSGSKPYYTSTLWWCGIALMGIGELGNFAAYGFAPASLIAPLGCVSVIGKATPCSSTLYAVCLGPGQAMEEQQSSNRTGLTQTPFNHVQVKYLTEPVSSLLFTLRCLK